MRREFITKSTSGGCGQFETSPEEIEQEMLTAFCERRQTDRLKTNYRIDMTELVIIRCKIKWRLVIENLNAVVFFSRLI